MPANHYLHLVATSESANIRKEGRYVITYQPPGNIRLELREKHLSFQIKNSKER
jgi:hypothetical protein